MPNQKPTIDDVRRCKRMQFAIENVRSIDEDKRTVEVAFSSEAECEQWWRTILILEHSKSAVRLERLNNGGAVLFNHSADSHLGVVERAWVDADSKCRALVRFGRGALAEEKYQDVLDGILRHISVGFETYEVKLVEERDNSIDVYKATDWEPYEISFVTIPMDDSVGVGRGLSGGAPKVKEEERGMPKQQPAGSDQGAHSVDEAAVREAALKEERNRTDSLMQLGRQYNAPDDAARFIREGKTVDNFRQFLLERSDAKGSKPTPDEMNDPVGLSERDIKRYRFTNVLRALDPSDMKGREAAAFELEVSAAAAQRMGRDASGIVVPPEVLSAPLARTYTTGTAAAPHGGELVGTDLLADSFISMLRKRTLLMQYGTQLAGLVGNVAIPKQLSGATAYVVGEDTDVTASQGDFGQVGLTPHTIGALSEISRRLLMQSSLDVEALIRGDLSKALALKIDMLGLYGTGTDEPQGIKNTSGVNAITFATAGKPDFTELVQMESEVAADDADVGNMAYLINARVRGHAKSTPKFANTSGTIWEPGNTINGYNTGVTNQVQPNDVFFGNFADLLIGLWGGLELTLDPYTHSAKGRLRIVAMQDVDVALRNGESFCVGTTV